MMNATWEHMTDCATPYGMRSIRPIKQIARSGARGAGAKWQPPSGSWAEPCLAPDLAPHSTLARVLPRAPLPAFRARASSALSASTTSMDAVTSSSSPRGTYLPSMKPCAKVYPQHSLPLCQNYYISGGCSLLVSIISFRIVHGDSDIFIAVQVHVFALDEAQRGARKPRQPMPVFPCMQ
jgi:hypothetical protein